MQHSAIHLSKVGKARTIYQSRHLPRWCSETEECVRIDKMFFCVRMVVRWTEKTFMCARESSMCMYKRWTRLRRLRPSKSPTTRIVASVRLSGSVPLSLSRSLLLALSLSRSLSFLFSHSVALRAPPLLVPFLVYLYICANEAKNMTRGSIWGARWRHQGLITVL